MKWRTRRTSCNVSCPVWRVVVQETERGRSTWPYHQCATARSTQSPTYRLVSLSLSVTFYPSRPALFFLSFFFSFFVSLLPFCLRLFIVCPNRGSDAWILLCQCFYFNVERVIPIRYPTPLCCNYKHHHRKLYNNNNNNININNYRA